jgi:hypothetical protein
MDFVNEKKSKIYLCKICNCEFNSSYKLQRHTQRKNKCTPQFDIEKQYKCQTCYKQFDQKSHYDRHIKRKTQCKLSVSSELQLIKEEMHTLSENIKLSQIQSQLQPQPESINQNNNTENSHNNTNSNNTISNNTQNNNNTMQNMTNTCLINYVVQQYPNAKNIEDCIKLENIPKMTLTECEDLYFTDGAMKIFKGLCDLGEENRPIHCTDASRCNYIYKSNDVWKIDVGGEAIRNHFFPVIQEAYTQVHKKRIKDNPGNSTIIGNYLTEMTSANVKKICQKTLKKLSNDFLAKNSRNSRLIKMQNSRMH